MDLFELSPGTKGAIVVGGLAALVLAGVAFAMSKPGGAAATPALIPQAYMGWIPATAAEGVVPGETYEMASTVPVSGNTPYTREQLRAALESAGWKNVSVLFMPGDPGMNWPTEMPFFQNMSTAYVARGIYGGQAKVDLPPGGTALFMRKIAATPIPANAELAQFQNANMAVVEAGGLWWGTAGCVAGGNDYLWFAVDSSKANVVSKLQNRIANSPCGKAGA